MSRCPAVIKRGVCAFPLEGTFLARRAAAVRAAWRMLAWALGGLSPRIRHFLEGSEAFHEFVQAVAHGRLVSFQDPMEIRTPEEIETWLMEAVGKARAPKRTIVKPRERKALSTYLNRLARTSGRSVEPQPTVVRAVEQSPVPDGAKAEPTPMLPPSPFYSP